MFVCWTLPFLILLQKLHFQLPFLRGTTVAYFLICWIKLLIRNWITHDELLMKKSKENKEFRLERLELDQRIEEKLSWEDEMS